MACAAGGAIWARAADAQGSAASVAAAVISARRAARTDRVLRDMYHLMGREVCTGDPVCAESAARDEYAQRSRSARLDLPQISQVTMIRVICAICGRILL